MAEAKYPMELIVNGKKRMVTQEEHNKIAKEFYDNLNALGEVLEHDNSDDSVSERFSG